jgi:hypothetical protein
MTKIQIIIIIKNKNNKNINNNNNDDDNNNERQQFNTLTQTKIPEQPWKDWQFVWLKIILLEQSLPSCRPPLGWKYLVLAR